MPALQPEAMGGKIRKRPPGKTAVKTKKMRSKITYKNYVWIEAENAVSTNFSKAPTYNFFCSNKHALQLAREADPPSRQTGYDAKYNFYIPACLASPYPNILNNPEAVIRMYNLYFLNTFRCIFYYKFAIFCFYGPFL